MDTVTGKCAGSAFYPETEQRIDSPEPGFAEQDPQVWYDCARDAVADAIREAGAASEDIQAIGIAYQMHGLVCVDKHREGAGHLPHEREPENRLQEQGDQEAEEGHA